MATDDRHQTNIGLLDSIIGIAGGVSKETRRLSFRMERAAKGEDMAQIGGASEPSGSGARADVAQEGEEYSNSTEIRRGLARVNPKNV